MGNSPFEECLSDQPLTAFSDLSRYSANARQYFEDYLPGPKRTVFHTKKGLSWRNAWGVLRYSANNAFIAFVLADQMQTQASSAIMRCVHVEASMLGTLQPAQFYLRLRSSSIRVSHHLLRRCVDGAVEAAYASPTIQFQ